MDVGGKNDNKCHHFIKKRSQIKRHSIEIPETVNFVISEAFLNDW